ncbi:MAG: YitT family protein [Bacteroidales bacterium]|nr:YitT family protein [Bacteroidales bacterium]
MMISTKELLKEIKNFVFITIGLAIFAFGWTAFLIPNALTGGGVSGIAAIVYFATQTIPVGVTAFVLNLALVAVARKVLGRRFCINTMICTLILSTLLSVGQAIFHKPLVEDMFMCAIIGSALAAFGVGMAINFGGNTGGTDIIALMIGKYRNISYGRISFYSNILIIGSSYFIVHSVEKLVYSMVVMFVYTIISDVVIDGYKQSYQIMVFSKKNREIADKINKDLHRGATLIKSYGSYTKEESEILLIIAHKTDKVLITRIIKSIDDTSFISISKTYGVFGKNFDQLKL